jgi:hypothetical protein
MRKWEDNIKMEIKDRIGGCGMDILVLGYGPVAGYMTS